MPKDFTDCIKNGGRVVRKQLKDNKYITICYDKEGKAHPGEVKKNKDMITKEDQTKKKDDNKTKIENSRSLAEKLLELKEHFNSNFHIK